LVSASINEDTNSVKSLGFDFFQLEINLLPKLASW